MTVPLIRACGLTNYLVNENRTVKITHGQSTAIVRLTGKIIYIFFPVAVVVCSSLNVFFIVGKV